MHTNILLRGCTNCVRKPTFCFVYSRKKEKKRGDKKEGIKNKRKEQKRKEKEFVVVVFQRKKLHVNTKKKE